MRLFYNISDRFSISTELLNEKIWNDYFYLFTGSVSVIDQISLPGVSSEKSWMKL